MFQMVCLIVSLRRWNLVTSKWLKGQRKCLWVDLELRHFLFGQKKKKEYILILAMIHYLSICPFEVIEEANTWLKAAA